MTHERTHWQIYPPVSLCQRFLGSQLSKLEKFMQTAVENFRGSEFSSFSTNFRELSDWKSISKASSFQSQNLRSGGGISREFRRWTSMAFPESAFSGTKFLEQTPRESLNLDVPWRCLLMHRRDKILLQNSPNRWHSVIQRKREKRSRFNSGKPVKKIYISMKCIRGSWRLRTLVCSGFVSSHNFN